MSATAAPGEGAMDEQRELWFDAVRDDPELMDAQKVTLLHECAADFWRKLEWADAAWKKRDADATAWAEQASRSAGMLAEVRRIYEEEPTHDGDEAALMMYEAAKGGG